MQDGGGAELQAQIFRVRSHHAISEEELEGENGAIVEPNGNIAVDQSGAGRPVCRSNRG